MKHAGFGIGAPELIVLLFLFGVPALILIIVLLSRGRAKNIPDTELTSQLREDLSAFIGNNAHKYLFKFERFNVGGVDNFAMSWHWPAFFVGFWWMLYRKIYLWALIAFILAIIPYVNLICMIVWGLTGNYVYYKYAKQKVVELRSIHPTSDISAFLTRLGGVNNWVWTIGIILIAIALIGIFAATLIPIIRRS